MLLKTIVKSKKENNKTQKSRKTNPNKKQFDFWKKKDTTKVTLERPEKTNIKRYHITGPLKETACNHTPISGLTHQRRTS